MQGDDTKSRYNLVSIKDVVDQLNDLVNRAIDFESSTNDGSNTDAVFKFGSKNGPYNSELRSVSAPQNLHATRPALPDPRLLRRIIRQRQLRARYFDGELFGDPAWDMLLDLAAARAEYSRVSITSLCIASGVPPTTALRWIGEMTKIGLIERVEDPTDRRRAFVSLTDKASDILARYFSEIGTSAKFLV